MNSIQKKGFTLIEMMVSMAIVSILVSIVVANLSDVRTRNRTQVATTMLEGVRSAAMVCIYRSSGLISPSGTVGGGTVCTETDITWPKLPGGWTYGVTTSNPDTREYSYTATDGAVTITCTQASPCL